MSYESINRATGATPPSYSPPPPAMSYMPGEQRVNTGMRKNFHNYLSFMFGFLALYPFVGIVFGIVAVVFGMHGRKYADQGEATNRCLGTAGMVMGVVGIVLFFLWFAFWGLIIGISTAHN